MVLQRPVNLGLVVGLFFLGTFLHGQNLSLTFDLGRIKHLGTWSYSQDRDLDPPNYVVRGSVQAPQWDFFDPRGPSSEDATLVLDVQANTMTYETPWRKVQSNLGRTSWNGSIWFKPQGGPGRSQASKIPFLDGKVAVFLPGAFALDMPGDQATFLALVPQVPQKGPETRAFEAIFRVLRREPWTSDAGTFTAMVVEYSFTGLVGNFAPTITIWVDVATRMTLAFQERGKGRSWLTRIQR